MGHVEVDCDIDETTATHDYGDWLRASPMKGNLGRVNTEKDKEKLVRMGLLKEKEGTKEI